MNDNQKEFLNELAKLFHKYNIDMVCVENVDEDVAFWSNNQKLAFYKYTGYKRESASVRESGKAPVGIFSGISTFDYEDEYYSKEEEPDDE